jgi:hypothetical protein
MVVSLVQKFFPELDALAQQQVDTINDPDILYKLHLKLRAVQRPEEARRIFLAGDES